MKAFGLAATPQVYFGAGMISVAPTVLETYGKKIVLVTGAHSFLSSIPGLTLLDQLHKKNFKVEVYKIPGEPSPAVIDTAVTKFSAFEPDAVIAIGGGSVLDAGKAIAAMLVLGEPVAPYLEGVGTKSHPGTTLPFVAVPTTAGTGSEATKNAVLSETGAQGFKKSLRHNNFVPKTAILDPALTVHCPPAITAASGMDAFTQLLESYLSTAANPVTDALALEGLKRISGSLPKAFREGTDLEARADMMLAAYLSGITLANAGLGLVHGFASAVGGYFKISHGVICSALMNAANRVTVRKLRATQANEQALAKYAAVGKIFSALPGKTSDYYADFLLDLIATWGTEMAIPILSQSGVTPQDFPKILSASDNKNNPIALNAEEMTEVLQHS
ncbi:MAG TPA: iron-containing alcohol dehydrogenase [Chryseolinea sp.]